MGQHGLIVGGQGDNNELAYHNDEDNWLHIGQGDKTMKMIHDLGNVDLVVDVGDFDYWGRCNEEYIIKKDIKQYGIRASPTVNEDDDTDTLVRYTLTNSGKWQIGSGHDSKISKRVELTDTQWENLIDNDYIKFNTVIPKDRKNCNTAGGRPYDGPYEWYNFIRKYKFDFLGSSGNAEVAEVDDTPNYGSPTIWKDHQQYLYKHYKSRIYNKGKGICRGYRTRDFHKSSSMNEYGERYSCYYTGKENTFKQQDGNDNNDGDVDNDNAPPIHHFLFLGWYQGSNERPKYNSDEEIRTTVKFIEREFGGGSAKDEDDDDNVGTLLSRNSTWRYCIHHKTTAKLSGGGGLNRNSMALSKITDTCRKYGAIIVSGHHHMYSRTKILNSVGGYHGNKNVTVVHDGANNNNRDGIISQGQTISLTVGMGGFE